MYFASNDTLEPKDLSLLRRVLEEICSAKGLPLTHPDAATIAQDLINWRLFGIQDGDQLKAMLKPLNSN